MSDNESDNHEWKSWEKGLKGYQRMDEREGGRERKRGKILPKKQVNLEDLFLKF